MVLILKKNSTILYRKREKETFSGAVLHSPKLSVRWLICSVARKIARWHRRRKNGRKKKYEKKTAKNGKMKLLYIGVSDCAECRVHRAHANSIYHFGVRRHLCQEPYSIMGGWKIVCGKQIQKSVKRLCHCGSFAADLHIRHTYTLHGRSADKIQFRNQFMYYKVMNDPHTYNWHIWLVVGYCAELSTMAMADVRTKKSF